MDQVTPLGQSLAIPFVLIGLIIFLLISLKLLLFPRLPDNQVDGSRRREDVKVVMSGAMGGGKTHLWSRLVYGTDHIETVTSMIENRIMLKLDDYSDLDEKRALDSIASLCLVDTPGHPRLSCRSLARNLPDAIGIIFVIDSPAGLSGKGLRDTSRALELVLSLLQLLHYQNPNTSLPQLCIHLANPIPRSNGLSKSAIIEKTKASLIKELNRRKLNPTVTSNSRVGPKKKSRLESLDAIPSSEFNSFYDIIKRFLNFGRSSNLLLGQDETRPVQLPEEETEVTKLLEEEEDNLTVDDKLLDPLERYQHLSGHSLHWSVSGTENENAIDLIKKWMRSLID